MDKAYIGYLIGTTLVMLTWAAIFVIRHRADSYIISSLMEITKHLVETNDGLAKRLRELGVETTYEKGD